MREVWWTEAADKLLRPPCKLLSRENSITHCWKYAVTTPALITNVEPLAKTSKCYLHCNHFNVHFIHWCNGWTFFYWRWMVLTSMRQPKSHVTNININFSKQPAMLPSTKYIWLMTLWLMVVVMGFFLFKLGSWIPFYFCPSFVNKFRLSLFFYSCYKWGILLLALINLK